MKEPIIYNNIKSQILLYSQAKTRTKDEVLNAEFDNVISSLKKIYIRLKVLDGVKNDK